MLAEIPSVVAEGLLTFRIGLSGRYLLGSLDPAKLLELCVHSGGVALKHLKVGRRFHQGLHSLGEPALRRVKVTRKERCCPLQPSGQNLIEDILRQRSDEVSDEADSDARRRLTHRRQDRQ
jgi:hypothetical protein